MLTPTFKKPPQPTQDQAAAAGYDCGRNGATEENCNFRFFMTPELTRAWEEGKEKAKNETIWDEIERRGGGQLCR